MELSSQEGEIPIPLNSTYGGHGQMIHHDPTPPHHNHNHIIPSSAAAAIAAPQILSNGPSSMSIEDHVVVPYKKAVKYRECLKNHAASMGGNATDGCGEFMPSGEEGTIEALTCSACNCHRNFHRKEVEGEQQQSFDCYPFSSSRVNGGGGGRKLLLGHPHHKSILPPEALGYPTATGTVIHSRSVGPTPHQMIMSYNMPSLPSESDEQGEDGGGVVGSRPLQLMKKRFRTKFTQEQKEKMLDFAEKVGWKIQKQEESVVQQFCQEIGVKRRVLKVWMHNNKHNLAKRNPSNPTTTTINTTNTGPAAVTASAPTTTVA